MKSGYIKPVRSAKMKKEDLLTSWKEIASYLDRDVRTCRRWEKKYSLPIHRMEGTAKSSIFAYKDELDKWLKRRLNEKSASRFIFSRKVWLHKSFYLPLLLIGIAVLIISYVFIRKSTPLSPADFRIEESELIILNAKGKELWRYNTGIENLVDEKTYRDHFQFKSLMDSSIIRNLPHLIIKDINQDGLKEVLFSIKTQNQLKEGKLLCFSYKGTRLWEFIGGKEIQFGQQVYSHDFRIRGFDVCDFDNDGKQEIACIVTHRYYFPTQFVVLSNEGNVLGEYWSSGQFSDCAFEDLDGNGLSEIILVGLNNEYEKGCLLVFDTKNIKGCSPQKKNRYKCKSLDQGSEKYYILFPRTDVDRVEHTLETISYVDILKNRHLLLQTWQSKILFELNNNLELINVRQSNRFIQMHRKAKREGRIDSNLNKEYWGNLAKGLLYYDGENWVSQPSMNLRWKNSEN